MSNLDQLHKDILSQLPFSITGYIDLDKRIDLYFNSLAKNNYITEKKHINFISYAYCTLNNIITWEVEELSNSRFFFHCYKEQYNTVILLDLYNYLKEIIKREDNEISDLSPARILSELFISDASYRVKFSESDTETFHFDYKKNKLEFKIPFYMDGSPLKGEYLAKQLREFSKQVRSIKDLKTDYTRIKNIYHKDDNISDDYRILRENYFNTIIDINAVKDLIHNLHDELLLFHQDNPQFFVGSITKDKKFLLKEFIASLIPVAFLSKCTDSWVEYFPCIVNVDEKITWDERIKEYSYRTLGAFILGYEISENEELELPDRDIFKLIGDRIGNIVAAQVIYKKFKIEIERVFVYKLNEFLRKLDHYKIPYIDNFIHVGHPKQLYNKWKSNTNKNNVDFFNSYYTEIIKPYNEVFNIHQNFSIEVWEKIEKACLDKNIEELDNAINDLKNNKVYNILLIESTSKIPESIKYKGWYFISDDWYRLILECIKKNANDHGNLNDIVVHLNYDDSIAGHILVTIKTSDEPLTLADKDGIIYLLNNCEDNYKRLGITGLAYCVCNLYHGQLCIESSDGFKKEIIYVTSYNNTVLKIEESQERGVWYKLIFKINNI